MRTFIDTPSARRFEAGDSCWDNDQRPPGDTEGKPEIDFALDGAAGNMLKRVASSWWAWS